jgi:hypothetical protein
MEDDREQQPNPPGPVTTGPSFVPPARTIDERDQQEESSHVPGAMIYLWRTKEPTEKHLREHGYRRPIANHGAASDLIPPRGA